MSKIAFISNSDWNLSNFRSPLILDLVNKGHQVICISGKSEQKFESELLKICQWRYLKYISPRGLNPLTEIKLCHELYSILKEIKPDLVLCYTLKINCYAGIICHFLDIPYLINITGLGSEFKDDKGYPFFIKLLLKKSLSHSAWALFHNDEDRVRLIADNLIKDNKTGVINGSGIDIQHFTSERKIKSVEKFVFIGRVLKEKGIVIFIKAALELCKKYKNLKFYIIGNQYQVQDREVEELICLAQAHSCFVFGEFTNDVWSMLDIADCFVLPSQREGLSKALMEAMAMQRIVIASNVPGCRGLVINKQNGFLMNDYSVEALVQLMEEVILLNEYDLDRICTHARNTILDGYTTIHIVNQYREIIDPILNK